MTVIDYIKKEMKRNMLYRLLTDCLFFTALSLWVFGFSPKLMAIVLSGLKVGLVLWDALKSNENREALEALEEMKRRNP